MKKITLLVRGMKCQGCVATVKNTLASFAGVEKVEVELTKGKVIVQVQDTVMAEDLVDLIHEKTSYQAQKEDRSK